MNIVFIPVRCGSKSIKFKNIKNFNSKPLVYWCALAAQNSEKTDKVVIATDCDQIADTVKEFNFSKLEVYKRRNENAKDTSSTEAVMIEYINNVNLSENDNFILAQATSPFTKSIDFDQIIRMQESTSYDSILSCVMQKRFYWNEQGEAINYDYKNRPRRQDFKGILMENGALYCNSVKNILEYQNRLYGKIGIYEMPEYSSVEIDEEEDWIFAEMLNKKLKILPSIIKNIEVKLFLSDIDGVLTDAGMYYTENGDELKKFSTYDGMGFKLLRGVGIKTGIVTSESRSLNKRRAEKLKVDFLYQGINNKLKIVTELCNSKDVDLQNVAYIGDDINDFEVLCKVGVAACPINASEKIKNIPGIIQLTKRGGEGAVREFIELILNK